MIFHAVFPCGFIPLLKDIFVTFLTRDSPSQTNLMDLNVLCRVWTITSRKFDIPLFLLLALSWQTPTSSR